MINFAQSDGCKDMHLSLFIAKKIRKKSDRSGGLSSIGTTIAVCSVALSVAVMICAMAIVKGFQYEIKGMIHGFVGNTLLMPPGQQVMEAGKPFSAHPSYFEELQQLEGIRSVAPVAYLPGMVRTDNEVQGIVFKGVDSLYDFSFYAEHLVQGRLPDYHTAKTSNEVLLSQKLAQQLHLQVGDPIMVYFVGERIRVRKFELVGLYRLGMSEFDQTFALTDLRQVQRLSGWQPQQATALELHWQDGFTDHQLLPALEILLTASTADDDPSLVPQPVSRQYRHIFDWLQLLDMNVVIILVLMVVVAGFNMVSGILILLFEKISMIGLLKALGMRTAQICRIFLLRGMQIVGVGVLAGNLIALLVCWTQFRWQWFSLNPENYFVDHVPIHLSLAAWFGVNFFAVFAIFLILWLPTLFISRVSPAQTIKAD